MTRRLCSLMLLAAIVLGAAAQRTIPRQRLRTAPIADAEEVRTLYDTLTACTDSCIRFSGFEKTLRARRENFFVTNLGADTIADAAITLTYSDMRGRMLHRRSCRTKLEVPPGETRRCDIRSWDTQQTFHYKLSPAPARAAQATPFDVKITADTLFLIPRIQ